jgi:hypothetical protein
MRSPGIAQSLNDFDGGVLEVLAARSVPSARDSGISHAASIIVKFRVNK